MCRELTSPEQGPGAFAEPTGRVNPGAPARGRRQSPRHPSPSRAACTGSRPVIPSPRATPRPAPLQARLSGLTSRETGSGFRSHSARQSAPGHGPAPPDSPRLKPEGHREQWTGEARPPPRSLAAENAPWKPCSPTGEPGPQPDGGVGRPDQGHCGSCSPPRRPGGRAGSRAGGGELGRCYRAGGRQIRGPAFKTPGLAGVGTLDGSFHLPEASVYLAMKNESCVEGLEGPFQRELCAEAGCQAPEGCPRAGRSPLPEPGALSPKLLVHARTWPWHTPLFSHVVFLPLEASQARLFFRPPGLLGACPSAASLRADAAPGTPGPRVHIGPSSQRC